MIKTLLTNRVSQLALACGATLILGAYLHSRWASPKIITDVVHDTKVVTVETPVLSDRVITKLVTDPTQQRALTALLKENHELKSKITQVTTTVASNDDTGGSGSDDLVKGTITPDPVVRGAFKYDDYQLQATYDGTAFEYHLAQKFVLQTSTGKDPNGKVISLVKLYEETPDGLKAIPAQTISINSDPDALRWMLSPRIQGGLSLGQDGQKGGFIGFQLLKRGTSRDPKDLRWSVGTIGVVVGNGPVRPVLLPVSFNVGSIPHQPFSNMWVSPTIDRDGKVGLVLSVTF